MSILDSSLKSIAGGPDSVASLARQAGLDPAAVEKALMVLARASVGQGDTIQLAAAKTGLGADALGTLVSPLGGEEALRAIVDGLSVGLGELGRGNFFKDLIPGMG
ncbi:MAG: hypothetical protein QNI87_00240 [Erythrobacter sp.]|uniref:hypothetical protein n=1 Tax=Erythrobacter sp. TaxID=1042 RepID=UPI00261F2375|nr:hypothetical protein [Erythrobacter sp.]MDJ0976944.1 hypothetical protein [Erythrobacter sp.]